MTKAARPAAQGQRALPRLLQGGPRSHRLDPGRSRPHHPPPGLGAGHRERRQGRRALSRLPAAAGHPDQRRRLRQHLDHQPFPGPAPLHPGRAPSARATTLLLVSGASGIVISHATYTFDDLPARYRARWADGGALVKRRRAHRRPRRQPAGLPPVAPGLGGPRGRGRPPLPGRRRPPAHRGGAAHPRRRDPRPPCLRAGERRLYPAPAGDQRRVPGSAHPAPSTWSTAAAACSTPPRSSAPCCRKGPPRAGMVTASEGNADLARQGRAVPAPTAARRSCSSCRRGPETGFGSFAFLTRSEYADMARTVVSLAEARGRLRTRRAPGLEERWLEMAGPVVDEVLERDGLSRDADRPGDRGPDLGGLPGPPAAGHRPSGRAGGRFFRATCPTRSPPRCSWPCSASGRCARRCPDRTVLLLAFGSGLTAAAATYRYAKAAA